MGAVEKQIKDSENSVQRGLGEMYLNMNEETFKSMRRTMPITRTKMEWNVNAVRMVRQVQKKTLMMHPSSIWLWGLLFNLSMGRNATTKLSYERLLLDDQNSDRSFETEVLIDPGCYQVQTTSEDPILSYVSKDLAEQIKLDHNYALKKK